MDPNELVYLREVESRSTEAKLTEIPKRKVPRIQEILDERRDQRQNLLWFIKKLTIASFVLLVSVITVQSLYRIFCGCNFSLLSGYELEILSTGVFGQIIGLIYIIVKNLWDDKNYLDFLK